MRVRWNSGSLLVAAARRLYALCSAVPLELPVDDQWYLLLHYDTCIQLYSTVQLFHTAVSHLYAQTDRFVCSCLLHVHCNCCNCCTTQIVEKCVTITATDLLAFEGEEASTELERGDYQLMHGLQLAQQVHYTILHSILYTYGTTLSYEPLR
jgi:hypothetical protein